MIEVYIVVMQHFFWLRTLRAEVIRLCVVWVTCGTT